MDRRRPVRVCLVLGGLDVHAASLQVISAGFCIVQAVDYMSTEQLAIPGYG